jgi:PST family polysaccharide transporter
MSSTIFLHSIISVGNAILYRNLNFKRIGFNSIIAYITSSCIAIAMAANGFGLYAVISAYIINSILLAILLYGFSVKIPSLGIDKKESKGIISFGGWLTAGVVLNNIGNQLDKLVLSKWLSVEALGSYNRPAGFVSSINTKIHSIFDTVLFPMLSDIQDDTKKVTNVFYRAVSLLNSFSVIFAAIFFFNAELIVTIFFGASWLDIVPIMQIGSIGVIFSIDHRLVDCFFRSLNYVKTGTQLRLIGVGLTLTSLYIGVQYGIIGVAWGILIANLILVLVKMITLAVKVKANIGSMFTTWLLAWKSAIIPIIVGGIYMVLPHTIISNIVFALIFGTTIAIEFVFFPQLVGHEYQSSVYPYVEKIKNKIFSRK